MPSRVVRAEINRSLSLSQVSIEAELTFTRLLTAADDYGRMDARPTVLKAELFPVREEVTPDMVAEWVNELASIEDPPIVVYTVRGRPYLQLTGWERHRGKSRRSQEPKYPGVDESESRPSQNLRESPGNPPESRESRVESRESRVEIHTLAPDGAGAGGPDLIDHSGDAPQPEPPPPKPADRARAAWPRLVEAAAAYGVTWRASPGRSQLATLTARIRDDGLSEDELVAVLRGYVALRGTEVRGDFNPLAHFHVSTLFAAKHWPNYLAAGQNPPPRNESTGGPDARRPGRLESAVRNIAADLGLDDDPGGPRTAGAAGSSLRVVS